MEQIRQFYELLKQVDGACEKIIRCSLQEIAQQVEEERKEH